MPITKVQVSYTTDSEGRTEIHLGEDYPADEEGLDQSVIDYYENTDFKRDSFEFVIFTRSQLISGDWEPAQRA